MRSFLSQFGEGINGNYYNEEIDYDEGFYSKSPPFKTNPLYYFVPLFPDNAEHEIVHETEKAILFRTIKGDFWVPKALLRENNTFVHKSFTPKYFSSEKGLSSVLDQSRSSLEKEAWCPVRNTDGREWLDLNELSFSLEEAEKAVRRTSTRVPDWDCINKCVRVVRVMVVEMGE